MRILTLTSLVLFLFSPAYAGKVTLKIATLSPDGTIWMKAFRKAAKEIKKETDGRVKLRYYPGGVMGNNKTVLRKMRIGQLHGGALIAGALANIHPDTQLYSLPFGLESFDEVDQVSKKFDDIVINKLDEKGFISYGLSEGGFAYMMSKHKITNLDEAKGRKVWIPEGDRISRIALEALGISPVPVPITDVLTGLQTGLIDTVFSPSTAAIALQWHTQVKHLTKIPVLYTYGSFVISKKALKRVSEEDKAVIANVIGRTVKELNITTRKDEESAFKALAKQGIAYHDTVPGEVDKWRVKVTAALDNMSGDRAMSPELVKQLREFVKKIRNGS